MKEEREIQENLLCPGGSKQGTRQDESGACTEFCAQIRSLWCRFLNAKGAKGSKRGLNAEGAKVTQRVQRRNRGLGARTRGTAAQCGGLLMVLSSLLHLRSDEAGTGDSREPALPWRVKAGHPVSYVMYCIWSSRAVTLWRMNLNTSGGSDEKAGSRAR